MNYPVTLRDFGITQYELLPTRTCGGWWYDPRRLPPASLEQSPVSAALLETIDSGLAERIRLKRFDISIKKKYHRSS